MCHKQRFPLHFIVDLKLSNTLENEHNFWHVECHTAWTTLVLHTLQSIVMRWTCLSVCLCGNMFTECMFSLPPIICACSLQPWLGRPLVVLWYIVQFRFYGCRRVCHELSMWKVIYLKWLNRVQHRYDTVSYTQTDPPRGNTRSVQSVICTIVLSLLY